MSTVFFVFALLLCVGNIFAFNMMKSSSIVTRKIAMKPLSLTPIDVIPEMVAAKTDLVSQGMLIAADPGPAETTLAFLFIAAVIMGTLQDFLKAFDKK